METALDWQVEVAYPEGLDALVSLSDQDRRLLAPLHDRALEVAPSLEETILSRLSMFPTSDPAARHKRQQMAREIKLWFAELFQPDRESYERPWNWFSGSNLSPISNLLALTDVFLDFGWLVTSQSPEFEQARAAFNRSLARGLALCNRLYEERQYQYDAALMLLD